AEEDVGDTRVAPVEEQVVVLADEDLRVVQVVVLGRLRQPVGGKLLAQVADARYGAHGTVWRLDDAKQVLVLIGQQRKPPVGYPQRGGPGPDMRLLDRAGRRHPLPDPAVDLGEPHGIRPEKGHPGSRYRLADR